ncbi:MAG TPA: 3'-5' exonuclease [bacterium]|nr:3'-5' exonuclease [bacterium]
MIKLNSLNKEQREAVMHKDGPVVVVAGAGTGKTRTIAYRTAYLLEQGVEPSQILAITFTNKAAREMRERISKMVGEEICSQLTVRTIHSLCVRILREDFDRLGRDPEFSIYDTSDQVGLIRKALVDNGFDPQKNDPRTLLWRIGTVKNLFPAVETEDFQDPVFSTVYHAYNSLLEKNNAVDFDDLLLCTAKLLRKKSVLGKYQDRYRYIMVDEYQDINGCQYDLIKKLAAAHGNLYVVGDDDQSIYGWRGAQVQNILNFERDFKKAREIKLEQNYRSTGTILEAAYEVIKNNQVRRDKKLWTTGARGDLIVVIEAQDENEEAQKVIDYIVALKHKYKMHYGDFAILYRTNAQSRLFEEKFVRLGISYIMVGGTRFFERREIKDVTAYLRAMSNSEDELSLLRIINFPARGIGKKTIERIQQSAIENKIPLFEALANAADCEEFTAKTREGIKSLLSIFGDMRVAAVKNPGNPEQVMKVLFKEVDFRKAYEKACSDANDAKRRFDNVQELLNAVIDFQTAEPGATIEGFLENVALMSDEQEIEEELREDSVVLMTLHSAKGLEFKHVFLVGVEEGYLPHERSEAEGSVDEERRLFYVGMTRARKRLFISHSFNRRRFGDSIPRKPSRFLEEIPAHLVTDGGEDGIEEAREEASQEIARKHLARMQQMFGE